jgi:DNA-binding transcriptional MocR family regulator
MEDKRVILYEDLARRLIDLIGEGAYRKGDRLPSIRELSESFGVSVNTVREAYALLENKRYIEAVPQSGYYVSDRTHIPSPVEPDPAAMDPEQSSICRIFSAMQKSGDVDEDSCGLSIAYYSMKLCPTERLQKSVVDAVRLHPEESMHYQMAPGYGPLREQIAIHGLSSGTRMAPDRIVVTSGCQEAIYLALAAVVSAGDTVAVESPVYFNLLNMLEGFHANVLEIPCSSEEGMSLETLEFALGQYRVSAVITIANFHNPTGSLMSDEKKAALVRMLSARGIPLIEDDIYGDLSYGCENRGMERPRTCKSFDTDGTVMYCSSFSKTLSPGLRLGWIEPGRWYDKVVNLKTLMNLGASSIPQIAVTLFLQDGGFSRHLRRLRVQLGERMTSLRTSVLAHFPEGTRVTNPAGGLVLWVSLPDGVSARELYCQSLDRKIMICPGHVFSLQKRFESQIRLNAGVWEEGTDEKIRIVGKLAKDLTHARPEKYA